MNPVTSNQLQMIKKVECIIGETFCGKSKQEAFLWLREYVPKAENIIAGINAMRNQVTPSNIQNANDYSWGRLFSKNVKTIGVRL